MAAEKDRRAAWVLVVAFLALQVLPVAAVALNAVAVDWAGTILPDGYTFAWIGKVLGDPRFTEATLNSLIVSMATLVLSAVLCVPAIIAGHCYLPVLDRVLSILVVVPYAVPGIVLALGLLRLYAGNHGIVLTGTPWILVLGYIPLGASFYYVPLKNNLRALATRDLIEAGYMAGAGDFTIVRKVILPSVLPALSVGLVMNFALAISEFVYANLLVGGLFPTLQIFMNVLRGGSGHVQSVVITAYFVTVWAVSTLLLLVLSRRSLV